MPIFEFKCSDCEEFFEVLFMSGDDTKEIKCPKCGSSAVERVVSSTNYAMGATSVSKQEKASTLTRNCSSGSCTTYTVPGDSRG